MTLSSTFRWMALFAELTAAMHGLAVSGKGQEVAPVPGGIGESELEGNAEILTRGPVHEAFAEAYSSEPEPALEVDRTPPEPIDEIPPEAMPEGDNVEWIPGYWAWDDERADFIWISGVWRNAPPGQRWVPGAWVPDDGKHRWTAGFWTSAEVQDVAYLPEPPPSQEEGPSSPAPDDNHFWVPGTWRYVDNDYGWQPGYWAPAYENWMWVPARYEWTPYGVIYCDGYWDYDIARRGVLFSPVYFPGYRYSGFVPRQAVSIGPLLIHLFVRPRYGHYYFGDYYGDAYAGLGIVPWLGVRQYGFYRYDPLFAFYQTGYFNGRNGLLGRVAGWHNYYRRHPDLRPRHTLADARAFVRRQGDRDANVLRQARLTRSLDELRQAEDREFEFRDVAERQREEFVDRARDTRGLERMRAGGRDREGGDRRLTLPRTENPDRDDRQVRARPPERPAGDQSRRTSRPDILDDRAPPDRRARDRSPIGDESPPAEGRTRERRRTDEGDQRRGRERVETPERDRGQEFGADRGREGSSGRRPGMRVPDVPAGELQETTPIPRPTEAQRPGPNIRERGPSRREPDREQVPRRRERSVPVPNANPPAGDPGNRPSETRDSRQGGGSTTQRGGRNPAPGSSGEAGRSGDSGRGGGPRRNDERRP